jgi:glutaredoxin-related protein
MGNYLSCCHGSNEYVPFDDSNGRAISKRICKRARNIIVISTSLNTNRLPSYNSRRLTYLLDAKMLDYNTIDLATFEVTKYNDHLKEVYRRYPEARGEIPILYIDGDYIGNYELVQELEDSGELDSLLLITELKTIYDNHRECVHCGFTLDEVNIDYPSDSGSFNDSFYIDYSDSGSIVADEGGGSDYGRSDYGTFI